MFKTILVTGGSGFIGSNFIRYFLSKHRDIKVINLDKLTYCGNPDNLKDIEQSSKPKGIENNPNYEFVHGDICDSDLVMDIVSRVDAIINFAAESHVDNSIKDCSEFLKTNIIGTQVLLEASKRYKIKRFYHISTDEVFGSLGDDDEKFDENTPYDPRSPYSASKASSDHIVRAYYHTHDVPILISNCSNNYGPYQYPEKLIPLFVTNLIEGKKVPVYGEGLNIRDWLYVVDHCRAIDMILFNGKIGETYCIGGDCEIRNIEITRLILKEMGFGEEMIEYVTDRLGHDYRYAIDFSKLKNELGFEPEYNFEEGLKETIKWYKENPDWWKKLKK